MDLFQLIDRFICILGIPIGIVLVVWGFVSGLLTSKEESSFGPSYGGMFATGVMLLIISGLACRGC